MSKQGKSKAPVLADCTFYYSPIKQQAPLGMQIPGEEKVHMHTKKNENKNCLPMLKQLLGDSLHSAAHRAGVTSETSKQLGLV